MNANDQKLYFAALALKNAQQRRDEHWAVCKDCLETRRIPDIEGCEEGEQLRITAYAASEAVDKVLEKWCEALS